MSIILLSIAVILLSIACIMTNKRIDRLETRYFDRELEELSETNRILKNFCEEQIERTKGE